MEKKVNRLLSVFSGGLSLGTIPSHSVFFVGQAFVPSVVSGSKLWWSDDSSFSLIRRFMRDYQHAADKKHVQQDHSVRQVAAGYDLNEK